MSAWSNLSNARYIDAVLVSLKANPKKWSKAWDKAGSLTEARNAARDAAWEAADAAWSAAQGAAWNVTWNTAWNTARSAARSAAYDAARDAARDAILALIVYDDCAHLLTTNPEHVKMMAGIGNEAAILLYPATLVFSEMKNECLV